MFVVNEVIEEAQSEGEQLEITGLLTQWTFCSFMLSSMVHSKVARRRLYSITGKCRV